MERFTIPKLEQRINEVGVNVYREQIEITPVKHIFSWPDGATTAIYDDGSWQELRNTDRWGKRDTRIMLRCRFSVPSHWRGQAVALRVVLAEGLDVSGPDGTAYIDGEAYQGVDVNHKEILLHRDWHEGEHVLAIEAYSGTTEARHQFGGVQLVLIDEIARAFYYDALVALQAAKSLPEQSYDRAVIISALDEAFRMVDYREPLNEDFRKSLKSAQVSLWHKLYGRSWPGERPTVIGVGHAHIDVAWLWTLEHTRKKTARTFLTALRLMEQYPDYCFTQSQPQLYAFMKREYPDIFEQVKTRIQEGRWEATGGMWLEADTNIPNGESLVRQILYGKRFLQTEFGIEPKVLWLPDVFGYSWALPQIIARSGMDYFMTTKISWNEYNKVPYDSFLWRGIDDTPVLTHFITTPSENWFFTYNGKLTPDEVKGTWDVYQQKRLNDEVLLSFGYGDGGGGPSMNMLETAKRLTDFPGMPRFKIGRADNFFNRLAEKAQTLPTWEGELYLEFHRGTYTSQAHNKRYNRKAEVLYHNAEALAALAKLLTGDYPGDALKTGWELILLNQFHDIIPGSSIGEVYQESAKQYAEINQRGEQVLAAAFAQLGSQVSTGDSDAILVFNTLGWQRDGAVTVANLPNGQTIVDEAGNYLSMQKVDNNTVMINVSAIPAYGWRSFSLKARNVDALCCPDMTADEQILENTFYRISFDAAGRILSFYDKRLCREVLKEGALGNQFILFEDKPLNCDAWNIDAFYEEKSWLIDQPASIKVIESGPVRAGIEIHHSFRHSEIYQRIYIYSQTPRVDFETKVDWHEHHLLLKVAFPLAVHNTRATYEIQFGNIERATHRNTSWDFARFEVPAQRWADLSEGNYGISLLNDCKYGYDVHNDVMRLTLLKGATSPDPDADQGWHNFTYSLYPHTGDWRNLTIQQAADLNNPLFARVEAAHKGILPGWWSLVSADSDNILIDTVKKAEDDESLIVRLYEAYGNRGTATLSFGKQIKTASECNLMEETEQAAAFAGNKLTFTYKPYQIRTFKVQLD